MKTRDELAIECAKDCGLSMGTVPFQSVVTGFQAGWDARNEIINVLVASIEKIAIQKLRKEIDAEEGEGYCDDTTAAEAYDLIIKDARAALSRAKAMRGE